MAHSNIELLIDYWRGLKRGRPLPARADLDPAAFAGLLSRTFIAALDADGVFRFRLAGEDVIDLAARPLAGEPLDGLWVTPHRLPLAAALKAALEHAEPLVVAAEAAAEDGKALGVEMLFAPLGGPDARADRFLGLAQPLARHAGPVGPLRMLGIEGGGELRRTPRLRLAVLDGRRLA